MTHWLQMFRATAVALLTLTPGWAGFAAAQDAQVTYEDQIKPLLQRRCAACHSPDKKSADLDVTNYTNLMQGGASGTVLEPGDPASSYLYLLITHQETPNMPPDGASKLPDDALALVEKWISDGALEYSGSAPRAAKPQFALAPPGSALTRPEVVALPPRMVLEPAISTPRPATVVALAMHPWAPLAVLSSQRQLLLYDLNSLELRGVLPFPQGQATVVRFSRDGSLLLAAGGQQGAGAKVYGWDVRKGEAILEIGDEVDTILAADVSADLSRIALGGPQKTVRVYATADGALLYEIKKHTEWITALEFSPDGVLLASGDRNGGLHIWETVTGNEYLTLAGHTEMISAVSWRHDSNLLASASDDDTIRLWEVENGRQVKSWTAHGGGVTDVRFSRDGNIASVGRDHAAKLWGQDGGAIRQFDGLADQALAVAVCLESGSLIGTDWSGLNRVWTLAEATPRGELTSNPPPLAQRLAEAQEELAAVTAEFQQSPQAAADRLQTAQQAVVRWQGEIDFKTSLDHLKSELETTQAALQERLLVLQQAEQEWEAAERRVEEQRAEAQSLGMRAAEVRDRIKALREGQ